MAGSASDKTRETLASPLSPQENPTILQAPSSFLTYDAKGETKATPKIPALEIDAKGMQATIESITHQPTKIVLQATLKEAQRLISAFESERQDPFLGGESLIAHQNAAKILSDLEALIITDTAKVKGADATSKRRADAVFGHLKQACSAVRQKLILPSTKSTPPAEPQWKMHRLRLEQTLFLETSLNTVFNKVLEKVAERARIYTPPKSVFICYAWPNLKDEREAHLHWIQPFLKGLRKHLHQAGLATVKLDIEDGRPGRNINQYMAGARTSDFVLLIGTESLISRHEMGLSAVCTELVQIRRKRRDDKAAGKGERVFPILLSGDYINSFPAEFDRYSTVNEWNGDHKTYFDHLCGLIPALYSTDKEAFEDIWQDFLKEVSADNKILITQGLKQAAIETRLSEEAAKDKADEEASNRAAASLLRLDPYSELKEVKRRSPAFESARQSEQVFTDSWHLPQPNDHYFTGRVAELKKLQEIFSAKPEAKAKTMVFNAVSPLGAVSGLGGVGKTQLAIYHIHHPEQRYSLRLWFQAETNTALHQDYLEFAQQYKLPLEEKAPRHEVIKAVKRYLASQSNWLAVYDNAGSYQELKDFLPTELKNGHLIITTRHTEWHDKGHQLEVDVFSEAEAIAYVKKLLQRDETKYNESEAKALMALVHELGYLPLALAQAGAYIKKRNKTIENYLAMYRTQTAAMLADKTLPVDSNVQPVATTWNISLKAIEVEEAIEIKETGEPKLSLRVLQAMAYLHSDHIPLDLLARWLQTAQFVKDKSAIERLLDKALGYLSAYSMIQNHIESKTVSVHRLVQEVVRFQLQQAKSTVPAITSLESKGDAKSTTATEQSLHSFLLASLTNSSLKEFTLKAQILAEENRKKALLPHLETLVKHYEASGNTDPLFSSNLAMLLSAIGYISGELVGDAVKSKSYHSRALEIQEKHCGENSIEVAATLHDLAIEVGALGDTRKAKNLLERALKVEKNFYDEDDVKLATTLNNLANMYGDLGDVPNQKLLSERSLKMLEKFYGEDHWRVTLTLNNLATAYENLGNSQKAKQLLERALIIEEKHYGKGHRQVARTLGNLATSYLTLKDAFKAHEFLKRALSIQEQHFGKSHPEVALTLGGLANTYKELGDMVNQKKLLGAPRKRHFASSCKCYRKSADPAHFVPSLGCDYSNVLH